MNPVQSNPETLSDCGEDSRKRTLRITGVSKTYQMGDSTVHA
ncbi:MAG: hypothetical protein ACKVKG_16235 [Alphaproteobacteria bacterium]|jgi:hypothetical protein